MQNNRMSILKSGLLIAVVTTVTILSCKKEELKYSCEEKAHKYALTHIESSQNISRDSLVKLERGLQFAVFRSLTPENKKRIFNEKIDLVIATTDLKEDEKTHLLTLRNYFEPSMYDSGDETPYLKQWAATAKTSLGWTDNMIQGTVGTWATPQELTLMAGKAYNMEIKNGSCTCNYDISCAGVGDCKSGGCEQTAGGCGILGTANCKGNCPEDRIKPSGGISNTVN